MNKKISKKMRINKGNTKYNKKYNKKSKVKHNKKSRKNIISKKKKNKRNKIKRNKIIEKQVGGVNTNIEPTRKLQDELRFKDIIDQKVDNLNMGPKWPGEPPRPNF